jgi:hypothetical protein
MLKDLAPNTPVIVGIGFEQETSEDPTPCAEPWGSWHVRGDT